ncbi:MAG: efflux RND transporter permease subunit [Pseudobdellovibrionaceae bacterium]
MLNRRIIYFITTVLVLLGVMAFFQMPREEDPRIKKRNALARVIVPGATPERIFRQVVRPLEDELGKVEELKEVSVEIRLNVAVLQLELVDDVKDIPLAWREVERAIERSRSQIPPQIELPVLDYGVLDVESVIFAVTGAGYPELVDASNQVKDEILKNSQVAEVRIFGSPQLEIRTEIDEQKMFDRGISILQLVDGLQQKNSGAQTGFLLNQGERIVLDQANDIKEVSSLENLKFETRNFTSVKLKDFSVSRRIESDPPQNIFRWNGRPAIGIGVVAKEGLNIEAFGARLMSEVPTIQEKLKPLKLEVVAYQPQRTSDRIHDLMWSLLSGMLLIALCLVFLMGPSTALLVTVMVPVISSVGLFIYFMMGGVLHQISIAAFIISVGQFIDNVIVVVDQMQTRVNSGEDPEVAAQEVSVNLRWPMAFATLTGICAFLPMYSSQGSTADFVTALPLVAMITLVASYFVTLYFAPLVAARVIKPRASKRVDQIFKFLENIFTQMALGPLWRVGVLVAVIFGVSILGLVLGKKEFFPESDRNEFLLTLELKQSADISATQKIVEEVEAYIQKKPEVTQIAAFAGGDIPRFYYNIPNFQRAPQVGQLLLTVKSGVSMKALGQDIETHFSAKYPEISFVALYLQQGPPINAKVELRFFSEDQNRLKEASQYFKREFQNNSKMRAIRVDEATGLKAWLAETKDLAAASLGFTNREVNAFLAFYSTGIPVSVFRFEREPLIVRVRAQENLNLTDEKLKNSLAYRGRDRDFLVGDLVHFTAVDSVPVIRRKNSETYLRALSDLQPGSTFSELSGDLERIISGFPVKAGERFEMGGDAEGAGDANTSILKVVPVAMALLILFLLLEFKSYRKVLIANLALPVTILGVFPGLWLAGAPFGFMSLLGLLALVGISVNNIILLLEALEETGSLEVAIQRRIRAIFLTTTLTLAGLIPLALDSSSLWPPLAWTMISGLITGTVATLIVVPALYRIFFGMRISPKASLPIVGILAVGLLFPWSGKVEASEILSFQKILSRVAATSESRSHQEELLAEKASESAQWRETWLPKAQLGLEAYQRSDDLFSNSAFGPSKAEDKNRMDRRIEIEQRLFNKSLMLHGRSGAQKNLEAAVWNQKAHESATQLKFLGMVLGVQEIQIQKTFLKSQITNLEQRMKDIGGLVERGRVSRADLLRLKVLKERAEQQWQQLTISEEQMKAYLATEKVVFSGEQLPRLKSVDSLLSETSPPQGSDQQKSLRLKAQALSEESAKVASVSWPQVSAFARDLQVDGRSLQDHTFSEVGLRLYWEIPLDGLRSRQAESIAFQKNRVEAQALQLEKYETTLAQEKEAQLNNLKVWKKEMQALLDQAGRSKKSEETKFYDGRIGLSDLIEADNLNLELTRDLSLVEIEATKHCLELQRLNGQALAACLP